MKPVMKPVTRTATKIKVFLLEDDSAIVAGITQFLTSEGCEVHHETTIAAAQTCLWNKYDILVFYWNLPDGSSTELLKRLRAQKVSKPVLFLTGKTDVISKVLGLELGADDYMVKPFEPQELLARLKALLRRARGPDVPDSLFVGDIEIKIDEYSVLKSGVKIDVTRKEFDLLRFLAENYGKVFTRDELLNAVWGFESNPVTRTVDAHISQLRAKFGDNRIETVRGVGYRLKGASDV